jgi:hypothetical protein
MKAMSTQKMKMSADEASGTSESAAPSQKPKLKKKMTTKKMSRRGVRRVRKCFTPICMQKLIQAEEKEIMSQSNLVHKMRTGIGLTASHKTERMTRSSRGVPQNH